MKESPALGERGFRVTLPQLRLLLAGQKRGCRRRPPGLAYFRLNTRQAHIVRPLAYCLLARGSAPFEQVLLHAQKSPKQSRVCLGLLKFWPQPKLLAERRHVGGRGLPPSRPSKHQRSPGRFLSDVTNGTPAPAGPRPVSRACNSFALLPSA
jgi:hypothetical protein